MSRCHDRKVQYLNLSFLLFFFIFITDGPGLVFVLILFQTD